MIKTLRFISEYLATVTLLAMLCGCSASPLNSILDGQASPLSQTPPAGGGYYVDPKTHLVAEAPSPPYYITDDGTIENTPPGQTIPQGAQPCESDNLVELQPGSACYAAAVREEQESDAENDRMLQSERDQTDPPENDAAKTTSSTAETCSVADGNSLRNAIEVAMEPPGGGPEPQVVQLINFQMAQTTLGWACTVEVDFLGRSYQILAYKRLPNGQYRMQTQLMGQASMD